MDWSLHAAFDATTIPGFLDIIGEDNKELIPKIIHQFWCPETSSYEVRRCIYISEVEIDQMEIDENILGDQYLRVHQNYSSIHVGAVWEICAYLKIPYPKVAVKAKEYELMKAARLRGYRAGKGLPRRRDNDNANFMIALHDRYLKKITDLVEGMVQHIMRADNTPINASRCRAIHSILLLNAEAFYNYNQAYKLGVDEPEDTEVTPR